MFRHSSVFAAVAAWVTCAHADLALSVNLDPAAPAGRVTADIFADLTPGDKWTVGGLRAFAMNGATFHYHTDNDANTTNGDLLIAPYRDDPVTDQHVTSLSRPRNGRTNVSRFDNNALAALFGQYVPPAPPGAETATATQLNVAWFASPPNTVGSPSVDGYVARISLDFVVPDGATMGVGQVDVIPANATPILMSYAFPGTSAPCGLVGASFQRPNLIGFDWAVWYVPEPAGVLCLGVLASASGILRRRGF